MICFFFKDYTSYPANGVPIEYPIDIDYIYKHIRRDKGRGAVTYKEAEENGVTGIRITTSFPYGSIDYGFLPHSWEELSDILENTKPLLYLTDDSDIPPLEVSDLQIIDKTLEEGKNLDSVFPNGIPTNCIVNKTICGCGATYLEIEKAKRDSIIIEPKCACNNRARNWNNLKS